MTARLKLTRPEPLESVVQSMVRTALRYHPAVSEVFRINSGAHVIGAGKSRRFVRYHDIKGMSDLWVILRPEHGTRQGFVEVKRPSTEKDVSEDQRRFLSEQGQRGHIAFIATGPEQARMEFDRQLKAWPVRA